MAIEILFKTKSLRKNVPDMGIELGSACMPSEHASDRATALGFHRWKQLQLVLTIALRNN